MSNTTFYTNREEKANYITHAIGVAMAIVASYILINKAWLANDGLAIVAYSIFGIGMIACMLASTIYHFVKNPKTKSQLRHFDHASIYLLIAASYSPFTFILLRDNVLWSAIVLSLVWLIAIVGITVSFKELKRNSHLKTTSYVLMGLVVFIAFRPLMESARISDSMDVVYWLVAGGIFYIIGAVIYATAKKEFIHAVFHIFVLLGLGCHIISAYLLPI